MKKEYVILMLDRENWDKNKNQYISLGVKVYHIIPDYLWTNILTLIQKTLKIGVFDKK